MTWLLWYKLAVVNPMVLVVQMGAIILGFNEVSVTVLGAAI